MAELDKKSDTAENPTDATDEEAAEYGTITETPKRSRKHDKVRNKDKHHKKSAKLVTQANKLGDSTRLRSARWLKQDISALAVASTQLARRRDLRYFRWLAAPQVALAMGIFVSCGED